MASAMADARAGDAVITKGVAAPPSLPVEDAAAGTAVGWVSAFTTSGFSAWAGTTGVTAGSASAPASTAVSIIDARIRLASTPLGVLPSARAERDMPCAAGAGGAAERFGTAPPGKASPGASSARPVGDTATTAPGASGAVAAVSAAAAAARITGGPDEAARAAAAGSGVPGPPAALSAATAGSRPEPVADTATKVAGATPDGVSTTAADDVKSGDAPLDRDDAPKGEAERAAAASPVSPVPPATGASAGIASASRLAAIVDAGDVSEISAVAPSGCADPAVPSASVEEGCSSVAPSESPVAAPLVAGSTSPSSIGIAGSSISTSSGSSLRFDDRRVPGRSSVLAASRGPALRVDDSPSSPAAFSRAVRRVSRFGTGAAAPLPSLACGWRPSSATREELPAAGAESGSGSRSSDDNTAAKPPGARAPGARPGAAWTPAAAPAETTRPAESTMPPRTRRPPVGPSFRLAVWRQAEAWRLHRTPRVWPPTTGVAANLLVGGLAPGRTLAPTLR